MKTYPKGCGSNETAIKISSDNVLVDEVSITNYGSHATNYVTFYDDMGNESVYEEDDLPRIIKALKQLNKGRRT